MSKIRVFVSSSLTELESEREVAQETINQLDLEPVLFEVLPAMDKTLECAYLDEIRKSHIFALILWKDVPDAVEKEYLAALDFGLPMLLLVKSPTFRESRTPRLEKLLDGTSDQELSNRTQYVPFRKKFRTLAQLRHELKEGLMRLISERFTEPALTTTSVEVTARTTLSLVQSARRRLLLVVKTPMILFGPRPYFSEHKNYVEDSFYQALTTWINGMKEDETRRMLYLYSVEDTINEMNENRLEQIVEKNLEKYKRIEDETRGRFELSSIQEYPGRILVSDNSFGIQFRAPKDKVICVFRQDANIATNLQEVLCEYRGTCDKSLGNLLTELELP